VAPNSDRKQLTVTTEGLQFLQIIKGPLAVLCVAGQPKSGKTSLLKKLLECRVKEDIAIPAQSTFGLQAYPKVLKVLHNDELGNEREISVAVIDTEGIMARGELSLATQMFALATLLSSHMIYWTPHPINQEDIGGLSVAAELFATVLEVKGKDSKIRLPNYMPSLSWVFQSEEQLAPDAANAFLEHSLAKSAPKDSPINKVKTVIRHLFRRRSCFTITSLSDEDLLQSLTSSIFNSTALLKVNHKPITGPVLCNILQSYLHSLNKQKPIVISSAFERAVAAEARRCKEKWVFVYLDKMRRIEEDLPVDPDSLHIDHSVYLWNSLEGFDTDMQFYADGEEVRSERKGLYERTEDYIRDIKDQNFKVSLEACTSAFAQTFNPKYDLANLEQIISHASGCIAKYRELSKGPHSDGVLADKIEVIFQYILKAFQSTTQHSTRDQENFLQILAKVEKHREEATENEARLRKLLEQTTESSSKELKHKELQLAEIQATMNSRAQEAESKVRELVRTNSSLKQDLENCEREKEMFIQAAKDLYETRLLDLRNEVNKNEADRKELQIQLDGLMEEHREAMIMKDEQINELASKIRVLQSQVEPSQKEDISAVIDFRDRVADMMNRSSGEFLSRAKSINLVESLYFSQSSLNKTKLEEQERRIKLTEDYEEKLRELRSSTEENMRRSTMNTNLQITELRNKVEELTAQVKALTSTNASLSKRLQITENQREGLRKGLIVMEQRFETQLEVLESHKVAIEALSSEMDEKLDYITKLKYENMGREDDNDVLLRIMKAALDFQRKGEGSLEISVRQVHDASNRRKVEALLEKFRIPC